MAVKKARKNLERIVRKLFTTFLDFPRFPISLLIYLYKFPFWRAIYVEIRLYLGKKYSKKSKNFPEKVVYILVLFFDIKVENNTTQHKHNTTQNKNTPTL